MHAARPRFAELLVAGSLALAACSAPGQEAALPTDTPGGPPGLAALDEHHVLGEPLHEGGLTVWPVLTDTPAEIGDFLTLADAQKQGVADVREIADEEGGAQVGTLVVENKSELPLLVCAGTLVSGGKQDRQIAQDFVVAAGETTPVDAFCVEAARWDGSRDGVVTKGKFDASGFIASSSVRASGQYLEDQSDVWNEVAAANAQAARFARTRFVGDSGGGGGANARESFGTTLFHALDVSKEVAEQRAARVARIRAHFAEAAREGSYVVGFAYAIGGDPCNVRTFAHPKLFDAHFEAFTQTMVVEASTAEDDEDATAPTAADVIAMVRRIEKLDEQVETTRAANRNGYRKGATGFAAACYFRSTGDGGEEVVLTRDWTARR